MTIENKVNIVDAEFNMLTTDISIMNTNMNGFIFDKNGNVKLNILDEINSLHHKMKWGIAADTVKILYAYDIPDFTKNNYSSIYAWR